MVPTLENISEVAQARMKAIREHAHRLAESYAYSYDGSTEVILPRVVDDEALFNAVVNGACKHASRAGTAQAAVQWAISDLRPYDVLEPSE